MSWEDTTEGQSVNNAWGQLIYAYKAAIPTNVDSLRRLATRSING